MSKAKGFFGAAKAAAPEPVVVTTGIGVNTGDVAISIEGLAPEIVAHMARLRTDPDYRARLLAQIQAEKAAAKFEADNNPKPPAYVPKSKDDPRFYWPKDKPMPPQYMRGNMPPCATCRAVRLDNAMQAVIILKTDVKVNLAYFRCRRCGGTFKMEIAKGPY